MLLEGLQLGLERCGHSLGPWQSEAEGVSFRAPGRAAGAHPRGKWKHAGVGPEWQAGLPPLPVL